MSTRSGPPLPLMTQPIHAIREDIARVDPAIALPTRATEATVVFGMPERPASAELRPERPASAGLRPERPASAGLRSRPVPSGPAPEISLTQHALDTRLDRRLALVIDPDSERSAAFRVLRHHLLEAGRPQIVVVSSPQARDGKTTVALNLALALAECGRAKVLLAEAHLRRPQLARALGFAPPWCFAEQLAAHRHQPLLPWSFVEIPQLWLHLAAINPRIEKTQLLDAPAFAIAMERLRLAGYEHIVIDAPPVLGSADVNLIADSADAVLLAVRGRRSTTRDLRHAIDQVGATKVIGSVLVE